MILVIIILVVVVAFWSLIDFAAVLGLFGVLSGERIARCSQCHRFGLTVGGTMHGHGCPPNLHEHFGNAWRRSAHSHVEHRLHLGHH